MIQNIIFGLENIIYDVDYSRTTDAFLQKGVKGIDTLCNAGQKRGIFEDFEKGKLTPYQFEDRLNQLARTNLNLGEIDGLLRAHVLEVDSATLDLLMELHVEFKTFLMCNINPLTMLWADSFEFSSQECPISQYFHKTYCSYQTGYLLPDWRYLDYIVADSSIKPEETLVVDSNLKTLKVADGMGFCVLYSESAITWLKYLKELIKIRYAS